MSKIAMDMGTVIFTWPAGGASAKSMGRTPAATAGMRAKSHFMMNVLDR